MCDIKILKTDKYMLMCVVKVITILKVQSDKGQRERDTGRKRGREVGKEGGKEGGR